jgi:hypothetical protein
MKRNLDINNTKDAMNKMSDVKIVGNPDIFQLLCKASSEKQGFMKSTKAMETENGCVIQVTTQQKNIDGTYSISEALTFVPDVCVCIGKEGNKYLGKIEHYS